MKNNRALRKYNVASLVLVSAMTAIMCLICPIMVSLPISPIPFSLGTLAVPFAVTLLGTKKGTICVLMYILLGAVGLPVYAGFMSGFGTLLGSTGGYIVGYIPFAVIYGFFTEKGKNRWCPTFLGLLLGTVSCYVTGCLWLAFHHALTFKEVLVVGVLPYLVGDIIKLIIALLLGRQLKTRLARAL